MIARGRNVFDVHRQGAVRRQEGAEGQKTELSCPEGVKILRESKRFVCVYSYLQEHVVLRASHYFSWYKLEKLHFHQDSQPANGHSNYLRNI